MLVGIDVTFMHTNFGGRGLSGFEDFTQSNVASHNHCVYVLTALDCING